MMSPHSMTLLPTLDMRINDGTQQATTTTTTTTTATATATATKILAPPRKSSLSDGLMKDNVTGNTNCYVEMEDDDDIDRSNQQYTNQSNIVTIPNDFMIEKSGSMDGNNSVVTIEGIHDYPGYYCICLVILIGDMSRGVMFPTMWLLVQSLNGSEVTLGYAVASFSFGRSLVNPLFGYWSDTKGYTSTLQLSCTILLIGTIMYSQIQNVNKIWYLLLSQTVLGIGSGTLGVTRAYVADITDRRNRTKYMGWTNAVQYAGFTMTPAIGALLIKIFENSSNDVTLFFGLIRINEYTTPAYFMSCCVIFTMIMLSVFFTNRYTICAKKKSKKQQIVDDYASTRVFCNLTIFDCCIIGCMLLNLSTRGSIACFETLGIAIAQDYFAVDADDTGIIIGVCGTLGVISLLCMGELERRYTDVTITCGGMIILTIGVILMIFLSDEHVNPLWQYITSALFVYSIGYPIANTAVLGMFSKIIGRRPQGELLGWFASAGSAARVFFPILSGYLARYSSIETLFQLVTLTLLLSIIFLLLAQKTLNYLST